MAGSDSEEEAEEQMRISFLGDVKKGGKTSNGVLAGVADEQVHKYLHLPGTRPCPEQAPLPPAWVVGC